MKPRLQTLIFLAGIGLIGLFVMLCGLGLSFGMKSLSLFGFFAALVMFVVLRLILRLFFPDGKCCRDR